MTAEIAIMNKEAVALAADSAVTMSEERGQKIFTSANKLFALSKYHPVGIMFYGRASLMEVPWETIVKVYRSKLRRRKLDTLKEYAHDFIAFLDNGNSLFPEDQQKKALLRYAAGYFSFIKKEILDRVDLTIYKEGDIEDAQTEQITSDVIKERYDELQETEILPSIPKGHTGDIINKYGDIIEDAIKFVFEQLKISDTSQEQLRKIGADLFSKDIFPRGVSGVVIAGFGEEDVFPSAESFDIDLVANNKLKYRYKENLSAKIDFEETAIIIPLAQMEMVDTVLKGIDPYLHDQIEAYLSEIFEGYPEIIIGSLENLNDDEKLSLIKRMKEASNQIFEDCQKQIEAYKRKNVDPVMAVVAMLPKDELAVMAETLVNLVSFKRKVTMEEAETVGGPIDVAIISKGDGFVWIKRKHYFNPELNPQFFANYYRR